MCTGGESLVTEQKLGKSEPNKKQTVSHIYQPSLCSYNQSLALATGAVAQQKLSVIFIF